MGSDEQGARFNTAYAQAVALFERGDATGAEAALRTLLRAHPGEVNSMRVLGLALLAQERHGEAIEVLEAVVRDAGDFAHAHADLAKALITEGLIERAIGELRQALRLDRGLRGAWFTLGDLLVVTGDMAGARQAFTEALGAAPFARPLEEASRLLNGGDRRRAEILFRQVLREDPEHVGALCGLAAVSLAAGFPQDSLRLLQHASRQTAHLPLIHRGLAQTYLESTRFAEAEEAIRHALTIDEASAAGWVILGTVLAHSLRPQEALAAYDRALAIDPGQLQVLLSKGHALKTLGRRAECETAYEACLERQADFAEAYYSLADLKNYRFSDAQIAAMQALLPTDVGLAGTPMRPQLRFALGRAFEQRGLYEQAFEHYAAGNAARRRETPFDAAGFELKCRRVATVVNAAFIATRTGVGCADPAPIFIVGLPRSGSTLLEQVLASHSEVDGTMELPTIGTFVRELDHFDGHADAYPECLSSLPPDRYAALGARYIDETRIFRTDRTRFIDKMPNNFSHVGLIHLLLPHAIIIDVRRHPLDACFSAFKQYFAKGQAFSYDMEDLGRYYRSYVDLMDHWDRVLPGKVLRVRYESVVRDTEAQVRRLLEHCGLPFEPACLRFYENKRAVRTASSEQVRQPIYHSGIGYWRHFAAQLGPLRRALGDCLQRFEDEEAGEATAD